MKLKLLMIVLFGATVAFCSQLAETAPMQTKKPPMRPPAQPPAPKVPGKQPAPDLAAWKIDAGLSGGIGDATPILVGYVKNLGNVKFVGVRTVKIQYMSVYGTWQTAAVAPMPPANPGQIVQAIETSPGSPANKPGVQTRLVITSGDSNPGNDIYVSKYVPLPEPR